MHYLRKGVSLLHAVSKQQTNQKTLEAGQGLPAFVYSSKLAWQLFHLTATTFCTVLLKKKLFLSTASWLFRRKDTFVKTVP